MNDEICQCGHKKNQHIEAAPEGGTMPGPCIVIIDRESDPVVSCPCQKFILELPDGFGSDEYKLELLDMLHDRIDEASHYNSTFVLSSLPETSKRIADLLESAMSLIGDKQMKIARDKIAVIKEKNSNGKY